MKRKEELYKEIVAGISVIGVPTRKDMQRITLPNANADYIYIYIVDEGVFIKLTNDMRNRDTNIAGTVGNSGAGSDIQ